MRQLQVQVRRGTTDRIIKLAKEHGASSTVAMSGQQAANDGWDVILVQLPNDRIGAFLKAIEDEGAVRSVLFPRGVLPVQPPLSTVSQRTKLVEPRSTLELMLGALQSIGSWKGLLLYAAFSGLVAAYAVLFNVIYLLIAAMLIAPMGAPVMVSVIGTAVGDARMVGRGALRFFASLVVLITAALGLGYAYGLEAPTGTMVDIASYPTLIVLLALVGGAAGAQSQILSDRDSLVTGTATGFLIAVALSPTSAVLGLSIVIGRWNYVSSMAFIILLTFAGIILGGWLLLWGYGVHPKQPSAERGSTTARVLLVGLVSLAVIGFIGWQTQQGPRFRRADLSQRAVEWAYAVDQTLPEVRVVDASARFVPGDDASGERLLVQVIVDPTGVAVQDSTIERIVREALAGRINANTEGVSPYIQVIVVPGSNEVPTRLSSRRGDKAGSRHRYDDAFVGPQR